MKVLVVDSEPPQPQRDGASLRLVRLLAIAGDLGWDLTFASPDPWTDRHAEPEGVRIVARDGDVEGHLAAEGATYAVVILCRIQAAESLTPVVRRHAPQARLIFDTVDLHHVQVFRLARQHRNGWLLRQSMLIKQAELGVVREADATLVVTDPERDVLLAECPGATVHVVSNVHPLADPGPGYADRSGAVFVGFYGHQPNADAARHLVDAIWPGVVAADPGLRLTLVGAWLDPELASLPLPWLRVAGPVADLRPELHTARMHVTPLLSGAGVKGKVLEAMAHGLPVVGSDVAFEGIRVRDGRDALVANGAQATADAVLRLDRDPELWARLAEGGRALVAERFGAEQARAGLEAAVGGAVVA